MCTFNVRTFSKLKTIIKLPHWHNSSNKAETFKWNGQQVINALASYRFSDLAPADNRRQVSLTSNLTILHPSRMFRGIVRDFIANRAIAAYYKYYTLFIK